MIMSERIIASKSIEVVDAGHDRNSAVKHRSPNSTHNNSEVLSASKLN